MRFAVHWQPWAAVAGICAAGALLLLLLLLPTHCDVVALSGCEVVFQYVASPLADGEADARPAGGKGSRVKP
jgi:hypothetical protein